MNLPKRSTIAYPQRRQFLANLVVLLHRRFHRRLRRRTKHHPLPIDPNLPITRVTTLDEQVSGSIARQRLVAQLSTFFGVLAALSSHRHLPVSMSYHWPPAGPTKSASAWPSAARTLQCPLARHRAKYFSRRYRSRYFRCPGRHCRRLASHFTMLFSASPCHRLAISLIASVARASWRSASCWLPPALSAAPRESRPHARPPLRIEILVKASNSYVPIHCLRSGICFHLDVLRQRPGLAEPAQSDRGAESTDDDAIHLSQQYAGQDYEGGGNDARIQVQLPAYEGRSLAWQRS